jgi:hypothetical protein
MRTIIPAVPGWDVVMAETNKDGEPKSLCYEPAISFRSSWSLAVNGLSLAVNGFHLGLPPGG